VVDEGLRIVVAGYVGEDGREKAVAVHGGDGRWFVHLDGAPIEGSFASEEAALREAVTKAQEIGERARVWRSSDAGWQSFWSYGDPVPQHWTQSADEAAGDGW
jgi:hypothetical protein